MLYKAEIFEEFSDNTSNIRENLSDHLIEKHVDMPFNDPLPTH